MRDQSSRSSESSGQAPTRREFLRTSAAAVAGASLAGGRARSIGADDGPTAAPQTEALPPHRAIALPGVHGYAEKCVVAGERLHVRVSAATQYRLSIRRLGTRVDDRSSDETLCEVENAAPRVQPIHPGSYIHVANGLASNGRLDGITIECWLRPWRLDRWQGVVTQYDYPELCGCGLFVTPAGQLACYFGDGGPFVAGQLLVGGTLEQRKWRHVAATCDGKRAALWLDGREVASADFASAVRPAAAPLRLGAYGERGVANYFLDGDLAGPAIYVRALEQSELAARAASQGLTPPGLVGLAAHWPLDEERGETVRDASGGERHGRIVNRGTWMIGGPSFDASAVPRYDAYEPSKDPRRGHALRLAADDLYDCRWETTHEIEIPADARPGIHVAEAEFAIDGRAMQYPITFLVRRSPEQRPADVLVLCSTSTWTAYSATPFAVNTAGLTFWGTGGIDNSHPDAPAYCCYRDHHGGQPTYQIGLNMPWPAAGPDVLYSPPEIGYSHLMRGERFLHAWLEAAGYDYNVADDTELPKLLGGCKTLFINGHSEYWTADAYHAVDQFLRQGGTAIVLSGNTMFWRTSFDGQVMECRKWDDRIGGRPGAALGELFHAHDGRKGSLMRECGLPAYRVVGLECDGWGPIDRTDGFGVYRVTQADHPLLTTPTATNLKTGDTFGHAADGACPRAVGHEWDVRLSRLAAMTKDVPTGTTIPAEPAGVETVAQGVREGGGVLDYFTEPTDSIDGVCAELIDWRRPEGGRVINFGAIGAGWALSADAAMRTIMSNALAQSGITPRLSR